MQLRGRLSLALIAAVVLGACSDVDEDASPLEQCEAEMSGECCDDDVCDAGSLCDFDFECAPGGVNCSEPTGDRTCHASCEEAEVGDPCAGGGTCTAYVRKLGGDTPIDLWLCL